MPDDAKELKQDKQLEGEAQRPADSDLRFQHLIRNMVVAREEARRTRE